MITPKLKTAFLAALNLAVLLVLLAVPATMTHAGYKPEERAALGLFERSEVARSHGHVQRRAPVRVPARRSGDDDPCANAGTRRDRRSGRGEAMAGGRTGPGRTVVGVDQGCPACHGRYRRSAGGGRRHRVRR